MEKLVRKERIAIPRAKSSFLLVQCTNCGSEQTIFSATTVDVKCKVCEAVLAERTGGRARIAGVILRRLD